MTSRRFFTLDVFTETPLAGNPLAVVLDSKGLDQRRMQAIASEFNLSETVFVFEPRNPVNTARLRIFTPGRELPFAGHPTIGAAALIAQVREAAFLKTQDLVVVLEEAISDVVCRVRHRKGRTLAADFDLPKLPERLADPPASWGAEIAAGVGLTEAEIGFDGHVPSLFSAGLPFLFVPVRSLAALGRAKARDVFWNVDGGPATFLYTRETVEPDSAFHARMFAPAWGVAEDPATGSAAAAFAGVVLAHDAPADGEHVLVIEQGYEMGRPSRITLGLEIETGLLRAASIGGPAVIVSNGALDL